MTDAPPPHDGPSGRVLPPDAVTIRCREHGPLVVEMPTDPEFAGLRLRVTDSSGGEFLLPTHKRAVALCRCGCSATRPFCDGSHTRAGFVAAERAPGLDGR